MRGTVLRRGVAPILRVCVVRRGRCPYRPEPAARPGSRALQKASPLVGEPRAGRTMCAPTWRRGRYFVAPDDSAGAKVRARRVVAPHANGPSLSVGAGVLTGPRAATWGRPFVVASSISFASACGESSLIPLLRLSPPNPRLSPLGFGGGPIYSAVVVRRGGPACPPTHSGRTHRCAPTAARRVVLRHCKEGRRPDTAIRIPPDKADSLGPFGASE